MSSISLALLIFGVSYLVILTERIHKTIVALCGAAVMIGLGVVSQEEAFYSHEFGVDYNVVFLLIGMMVIINIVRETGLFEVLAIWAAQRADAKPFRLLVLLALLTAGLSAMLDNVTTVLLMAPVTLAITKRLELNPICISDDRGACLEYRRDCHAGRRSTQYHDRQQGRIGLPRFSRDIGSYRGVDHGRVRGCAVGHVRAKYDRGASSSNGGFGIEFAGGRVRSTVLAPLSLAAGDCERGALYPFAHSS